MASDRTSDSNRARRKPVHSETQPARNKGFITRILRERIVSLRLEGHSVEAIARRVERIPRVVDQVLIDELDIGRRAASRFTLQVGPIVARLANDVLATTRRECTEEREVA